jgi:phosphoenolpyruvate-protein kinase (PTS system EI component)
MGIMVEVPSAALNAEHLAPLVDFFSIGTNDLTQYTLAVDRGNPRVAHLASPYHPSVLKLIQMTIEAAHKHGKWVGLCGELAGDVPATALLLGLGLDEFSMAPARIPEVKARIGTLSRRECQTLAEDVLQLGTTQSVLDRIQQ